MRNKYKGPEEVALPLGPKEENKNPRKILPDFSSQSIPRYLTAREVADLLRISTGGVYNLVAAKEIPHFKGRGVRLLFELEEIIDWMRKRKVKENKGNDRWIKIV